MARSSFEQDPGPRGFSLGIAALGFGVSALVVSWTPSLGLVGLSLGVIGVLLGFGGLVSGVMAKNGSAAGFSATGALFSGVVAVLAVGWTLAESGRQKHTIDQMRAIAAANDAMLADTGHYATSLWELYSDGYLAFAPLHDGWGTLYQYEAGDDSYSVLSLGNDGTAGPPPPSPWPNAPYGPDLVLRDGVFTQVPGQ